MPSGRYADVIERLKPGAAEAGDIVHIDGRVLGRHDGIIHYTVGQRRGIGVAARRAALCRASRSGRPPRHRRPARGACDAPAASPRRQLARRRAARRSPARGARRLCARPLDAPAAAGAARPAKTGISPSSSATARRASRPARPASSTKATAPGARVLGGGWIGRTERTREAERALVRLMSEAPATAPL